MIYVAILALFAGLVFQLSIESVYSTLVDDDQPSMRDPHIDVQPIVDQGLSKLFVGYPKIDDEDIDVPFVKGIRLDEEQDSNIEILKQSPDKRIQHIRIRENCTREEAIRRTSNL